MEHALLTVYEATRFGLPKRIALKGLATILSFRTSASAFVLMAAQRPSSTFRRTTSPIQIGLKGGAATILNGTALAMNDGNLHRSPGWPRRRCVRTPLSTAYSSEYEPAALEKTY